MNSQLEHPFTQALSDVIRGMCAYPDQCVVSETGGLLDIVINICPNMADYRVVCGRNGRQIKALAFLAAEASRHRTEQFKVRLEESFRGRDEQRRDFVQNPAFDETKCLKLLHEILPFVFQTPVAVTHQRQNDKLLIFIDDPDQPAIVSALSDIFYPYGFRNGCIVDIRPLKPNESNPLGVRKVLGNQ